MSKQVNESQQCTLAVGSKDSVISRKHLSDEDFPDFGFSTEMRKIEEVPVTVCVEVDAIVCVIEGIRQKEREEKCQTVLEPIRTLASQYF